MSKHLSSSHGAFPSHRSVSTQKVTTINPTPLQNAKEPEIHIIVVHSTGAGPHGKAAKHVSRPLLARQRRANADALRAIWREITASAGTRSTAETSGKQTQELVDQTAIRRFDPVAQRLQQRAVDAILSGTPWLTSKEVGTRADPKAVNKHSLASRWLNQGRIFAIEHTGQKMFPDYGFDPLGSPIAEVQEVLKILDGYSPFRVASWFESSSSLLGGRKPRELLASNPRAVIEAARAHVAGPVHG